MPFYIYQCPAKKCRHTIELMHSMSECDKPSDKTLLEITCPKHKTTMKRVPQDTQLMGMKGGTSVPENVLLKDKQKQRKLRSRLQFKNEELAKVKDPFSKRYFQKKYSTDPILKSLKGDHEKIR